MGLVRAARLTGTAAVYFGSQVPETSPDRVTLVPLVANTRSCVGVKSLMTASGVVKLRGRILSYHFYSYFSCCYDVSGRSFDDYF